jgi:hypothetical protein
MEIRIFPTSRFGWCVEIDAPQMWEMIYHLPDEQAARAYIAQGYPGVTPTVEQPEQPTLFASTDAP